VKEEKGRLMSLPEFEHLEADTLADACSVLKKYEGQAKVIAGGTDLLNLMRNRLLEPEFLIDVKRISELKEIRYDENRGLVIGSGNTLCHLIQSPLIREKAPLLVEAARIVAAPPLQNMGTLGGNVCLDTRCFFYNQSKFWRSSRSNCFKTGGSVCHVVKNGDRCYSVFMADAACALVALNAGVRLLEGGNERILPLSEFYTGKGENPNALRPTEVLREIIIPAGGNRAGSYEKLSPRASLDFPQIGVAVSIRYDLDGTIEDVRMVLNAIAPGPVEIKEIRDLLTEKRLDEEWIGKAAQLALEASHPVDNTGLSPAYRRKMVRVLVARALRKLLGS
jgi:4-hydroxybenzoyl-CoA reductase subunit beta